MHFFHHNHKKTIFFLLIIVLIILLGLFLIQQNNRILSFTSTKASIKMKLPAPVYRSNTSIEEALEKRRSIRQYKNEAITLHQVSQLLWAAQGVTSPNGFRTAPSAGALYPLEVYLISGDVSGLSSGIYHYLPNEHALEQLSDHDVRAALAKAALEQSEVKYAAADIIITAVMARTMAKYGNRGKQYVEIEVGHAAQNVCLQAVSLGLGTVTIGAFDDAAVKKILNIPNEETPFYIMPIGKI